MKLAARWPLLLSFCLLVAETAGVAAPMRSPPQVALEVDPCLPVDGAQVRRLLGIELGVQLESEEQPPPAGAAGEKGRVQAHLGCREGGPNGGTLVELIVDDGVTGKALTRTIDLAPQDPTVYARLLAVALSELVFASWAELLVTPRPRVQPSTPPPPAATLRASSDSVARKLPPPLPDLGIYVAALGDVLVLFSGRSGESGVPLLAGGGLRVGGDHRHHLGWSFELSAQHGQAATSLGTVKSDLFSGRALLLSHYALPHLLLRGGAGLRFGMARLGGASAFPEQVVEGHVFGPWGGPLGELAVAVAAARLRIDLGVEAGYVIWPVAGRVAGTPAVSIEGPWLGITLSLGALIH